MVVKGFTIKSNNIIFSVYCIIKCFNNFFCLNLNAYFSIAGKFQRFINKGNQKDHQKIK
jgi:hypothetical protein